jgi:hypothetical protein
VLGKCRCCARLCMISEAIRDSGVPEYPETRRAARSLARDRLHKSRALDGVLWTDIIYHSDAICLKSDTRSPHIMPRDRGVSVFCSPGGCPDRGIGFKDRNGTSGWRFRYNTSRLLPSLGALLPNPLFILYT